MKKIWGSRSFVGPLHHKSLHEIYNFIFCGTISAAIYFLSLFLLERANSGSVGLNFSIAFIVSSSFNFFYNKIITFDAGRARMVRHGFNFLAMLFASYLSNLMVISFLVKSEILDMYMSSIIAIAVSSVFRFIYLSI